MTVEELEAQVAELTDQVRIMGLRNAELNARIQELQGLPPEPRLTDKDRWYGYKLAPRENEPARKGAFDMLEVAGWEGVQKRKDGPTNYVVQLKGAGYVVLPADEFEKFATIFDAYLKRP